MDCIKNITGGNKICTENGVEKDERIVNIRAKSIKNCIVAQTVNVLVRMEKQIRRNAGLAMRIWHV